MFEYSFVHWAAFLSAAILLNLAPGPDMVFIVGHTVRSGKRAGFVAMGGIWTGAFGHVLFAAAGFSAIVATSALAFSIVKWGGAAYLLWLGITALRSSGSTLNADRTALQAPSLEVFRQGFWVALLNPKVAVFFLAFLPQFVVPGAGPSWAQLFLHGLLIIVVAGLIEPPLILAGGYLTDRLRKNPGIGRWLDQILRSVLIALGLRLALERQ
ncbi:LysE family translocator [Breoghania sp.]|uniref:LysE family translocator n=1 Tax=Breoghania sp. TaxID=2065378 RepID=UPI00261FD639|nr:LysE family translocator [Breoghania sp.]MDJ0930669.1 LysE family translocator [Breoghania sp.]